MTKAALSPSLRGRGLKSLCLSLLRGLREVALFARAWIEIKRASLSYSFLCVALFARAWIEIVVLAEEYLTFPCRPLCEGVD